MARLNLHPFSNRRPRRSLTVHSFFSSISHAMNAPTASGSEPSMALADALSGPLRAYGLGTGSATIAGCEPSKVRYGASGT
jgi:hypothetical protein